MSMPASTTARLFDSSEGQPQPNDVILGRSARISTHPGNIRYRKIIHSNQKNYHACKTRLDRMIFIRQLTKKILHEDRIKFWKRENANTMWRVVDFKTVQEKVSHALRDSNGRKDFSLAGMDNGNEGNIVPVPHSSNPSLLDPTIQPELKTSTGPQPPQERCRESQTTAPNIDQYLLALEQRKTENQEELVQAVLRDRQRSASLTSVQPLLLAQGLNQPQPSILGGLPQLRLQQSRLASNLSLADPSILLHGNAPQFYLNSIDNALNPPYRHQVTANDMLLHRTGALGSVVTTPNHAITSLPENSNVGLPYQNRSIRGAHRLKKNLDTPLASSVDLLTRQNSIEATLENLESKRTEELKRIIELNLLQSKAELEQLEDQYRRRL